MEDNKKNVPVRSIRIMMKLVRMGFDVINVVDDRDNPKFKIFMFENKREIREAINN